MGGGKRKEQPRESSASSDERIEDAEKLLEDSESGESEMFPGGIDPVAVTGSNKPGTKRKTGDKPKPRNPKSKTDSSTGRRVEKEDCKSQRTYKDFVNCHLLNWFDETDGTFLSKDALKDARRIKLFSVLMFNFGCDNKAAVVRAAQGQYERRNRPAARTGWGVNEMHSFCKWQMREFQKGRVKKEAMGGWAWKLPAKDPETGAPAPLPKEVQDYVDGKRSPKYKKQKKPRKHESASDSDQETDSNSARVEDYVIMTRGPDKAPMLTQSFGSSVFSAVAAHDGADGKATGTAIPLPKLTAGREYQLGVDEAGTTILTGGLVPAKCDDIFKDRVQSEKKRHKAKDAEGGKRSKHRSRSPSNSMRSSKGKSRHPSKTPPASPRGRGPKRSRSRGSMKSGKKEQQKKNDPADDKPHHVALDPKLLKGMRGGPSTKHEEPEKKKEKGDTPPLQNSDVESIFAESPKPEPKAKEPFLVKCAEGTWLVHIASEKMILLPKRDEWSMNKDVTKDVWMVTCMTNDKHTPHTVDALLRSSRAVTYDEKTIDDKLRVAKEEKAAAEEEAEKNKKEAALKAEAAAEAEEEKKKELAAEQEKTEKENADKAKAAAEEEEKKKELAAEREKKKKEDADKAKAAAEAEEKKKKELAAEQEKKKKEDADKAKAAADEEEKKKELAAEQEKKKQADADKAKADAEMNAEVNKKSSEKKKK
ncbi:unnamed protein product, partial [Symbiodinium sp. CCMP2592]